VFAGVTLKDKSMAFYLCGKFGKEVLWYNIKLPWHLWHHLHSKH
jgi:hypothetical protein